MSNFKELLSGPYTMDQHFQNAPIASWRIDGVGYATLLVGDTVYVGPHEVHQLHNPSATEPFGFLCLVDAERDAPVPVAAEAEGASCELPARP